MRNLLCNMKKTAALILVGTLLTVMTACSDTAAGAASQQITLAADVQGTGTVSTTAAGTDISAVDTSNTIIDAAGLDLEFTANDLDSGFDEQTDTIINAGANSVSVSGSGASGVTVSGTKVTITAEGTYILSGDITGGQIIVAAPDTAKVHIVFNGISIHCENHSPVYIESADKVFITLAEGTQNTLTDESPYILGETDSTVDGVIFSKADLTLNGTGNLIIEGNYKNGIVSKDDLVITGGTYNVTAVGQGLAGKDCVKIKQGVFNLITGADGIQSDNAEDTAKGFVYIAGGTFTIIAQGDAIQAQTVLQIDGGTYQFTTGGGSANASTASSGQVNQSWGQKGNNPGGTAAAAASSAASATATAVSAADTIISAKGLKAVGEIIVNGGDFVIDSSDDALHSNADLTVNNGTFSISSGDDGIHADSDLSIIGGIITITKSYEGIEGYSISVSGGTIDLTSIDDGFNVSGGSDSSSVNGRPGQNTFTAGSSDMLLAFSGGTVTVNAGGDGLDSNGSLNISGGFITVSGPEDNGNGTLDFNGTGTISGGTLLGSGSNGMLQAFDSNSSQASIAYSLSSTYQAGTVISLADADGKVLADWTADKTFSSIDVSTADLVVGETYTLTAGNDSQTILLSSVSTTNASGGMNGGGR